MPEGLPTAAALIEQKAVTFFSIDTDVIQSHGYKFGEGALHAMALQRPNWFQVQLTDVVEREVLAHRMDAVSKVVQEMQSAISGAQRVVGQDLRTIKDAFDALDSERVARARFTRELRDFVTRLGGSVLPLDGHTLAHDLFVRYFEQLPPFEVKKKSEFPDAASLLVLEGYAKNQGTQGIVVSKDGGWAAFAKGSDHLYHVSSLDELVALFESKGEKADKVKEKLIRELSDPASELAHQLEAALENHVAGAYWNVDDIYSGYSLRVEAEVNQISYHDSDVDLDRLGLWLVEHDPTVCTVEVSVTVTVDLDIGVEFFQYDTIDHEEMGMGSEEISRRVEIGIDLFLMCQGDLLATPVADWDIGFEIEGGDYRVEVGEVNPDYGDYEE
jgi:hypothetical protein